MGFALPGAIGACFARGGKQIVAIQGDGSFQFNVQELQTIVHHNLPIVLFVWNNDGYLSIRASFDKSCEGRHTGTDSTCGISFPSIRKIADAYGIHYERLSNAEGFLDEVLSYPGPVVCEVMCQRDQVMVPKEG
jgi:acetolactate synthase-1/2/3 large subunit